jgi:hypothetical protein
VVEYVNFVYSKTRVHWNASKDTVPTSLDRQIPLFGPRFMPSSYLHLQKRHSVPAIDPSTAHLKPLNVIHPFYYASIATCPGCKSTNTYWDGWNGTGSHDVHGIDQEETAVGFQLRGKICRGDGQFCVATTSPVLWEHWEHWKIPRID